MLVQAARIMPTQNNNEYSSNKHTKIGYFHSRLTDSTRDKFSYTLGESIAILSITYQKQSGEYGRPCKVEDSLRDKTKLAFMLLNVHGGEMAY